MFVFTVGAGVVAVEVEHTSVRTVVPVAPAIHAAPPFYLDTFPTGCYSFDFFQPPSIRPISFSSLLHISWSPGEIRRSSGETAVSTRERSTSSLVSILFWSSTRREPLARLASMQSSSISMNAAVMCLRYSNFSGFRMLWVRSLTRIMLRTIRCRSCKLSMLLLLKRVEGGLVGRPLARFSDCQITGFPGYKRHGSRCSRTQGCGSRGR